MDGLLQGFFGGTDLYNASGFPKYSQWVDKEGKLNMKFALAGYPRENLHVDATDTDLVISVDRVDGDYGGLARRAFKKTFTNANGYWDFTSADVSYVDGMLSITISPKEEKKQISLQIK